MACVLITPFLLSIAIHLNLPIPLIPSVKSIIAKKQEGITSK
jgi:hypothetical protein